MDVSLNLCVRLFAAVAGLSALPMPLAASVAAESAPDVIRVGVLAYSPPWYDGAFIDETLAYLEACARADTTGAASIRTRR